MNKQDLDAEFVDGEERVRDILNQMIGIPVDIALSVLTSAILAVVISSCPDPDETIKSVLRNLQKNFKTSMLLEQAVSNRLPNLGEFRMTHMLTDQKSEKEQWADVLEIVRQKSLDHVKGIAKQITLLPAPRTGMVSTNPFNILAEAIKAHHVIEEAADDALIDAEFEQYLANAAATS